MMENPSKITVLLVDDHPVIRDGLKQLIDQEQDISVVGEADSAAAAMVAYENLQPDVAVVDLSLKDRGGLDLIKDLRVRYPEGCFLVLSMHDEDLHAERVLRAGARGYLMKQEATPTVLTAIRKVAKGEIAVSQRIASRMLNQLVDGKVGDSRSPLEQLSDRELEVFTWIGKGMGPTEIAQKLFLSVKTIETYRQNIKNKLHLKSGSDLRRQAIEYVNSQHV